MFVIAVSNHKGGVGKTTTALALATLLAEQGASTVAVGLDPQGNLARRLGVSGRDGPSVSDLLRRKVEARAAGHAVPHAGLELLRVVPAGRSTFQLEAWLFSQLGFEDTLRTRLAPLERTCDYVLLDCSPSLGALTLNAIRAADVVLVPAQCEAFAYDGVDALLDLLEMVRQRDPDLLLRVVPTLYDRRNRVCREVLARLQARFREELSEVIVGVDTRIRDAQARRVPLCVHAPTSRANEAYRQLARELMALAHGRHHRRAAA